MKVQASVEHDTVLSVTMEMCVCVCTFACVCVHVRMCTSVKKVVPVYLVLLMCLCPPVGSMGVSAHG